MKVPAFFLFAALTVLAPAQGLPGFIKGGEVYNFAIVGQRDPLIALVMKDEGGGWIRVTGIRTRDEFWLNLAHVQLAMPVEQDPGVKSDVEQKQIIANLRKIAEATDRFVQKEGRTPKIDELLGVLGYVAPAPKSIAGEEYEALDLAGDGPLTVRTKDGREVTFPRK
jgi:hypothetical protein